jgi:hypothetical protein
VADIEYAVRKLDDDFKPLMMARRLLAIDQEFRQLDVERLEAIVGAAEERRSRIQGIDSRGVALFEEKQRLEKFLAEVEGRA